MNDFLLIIGLITCLLGTVGILRPLTLLGKKRRWAVLVFLVGAFPAYAGFTRSDDGKDRRASHMLLDDLMPEWDIHEIHAIRIHAPPEQVYAAIRAVTVRDLGLANVLIGLRALPAVLSGHADHEIEASRPILRSGSEGGFFLLAEEPNRECVYGFIGQFWKPTGGAFVRIRSVEEFSSFQDRDHAKATWNFHLEGKADGTCRLSTETRVVGTDPGAKRKFKMYWWVVYPGSAYIRRAILKAVKRRAEARSGRLR